MKQISDSLAMWPIFKFYPFVLIFSFVNAQAASSSLADEVVEGPSLKGARTPHASLSSKSKLVGDPGFIYLSLT